MGGYYHSIVSGNVIDIHTGEWIGRMSGLGAGIDSFYEYMLKVSCILYPGVSGGSEENVIVCGLDPDPDCSLIT